jgi:hypothetical protein
MVISGSQGTNDSPALTGRHNCGVVIPVDARGDRFYCWVMATRTPKIRLLRDRRRAIDDQIATLENTLVNTQLELAKLREDAREFEIAERVLLSLGDDDEDEGQEISLSATGAVVVGGRAIIPSDASVKADDTGDDATAQGAGAPRKPPDIPSTPDMIFSALKELTSAAGSPKMKTPLEIMEFIRERWWPSVTSKDISPVVWRLANERRLSKDDAGNYGLPPPIIRRPLPRAGSDNNAV